MSPAQQYTWLRQAGFSHAEAYNAVNRGVIPRVTTEMKRVALQRWREMTNKDQQRSSGSS